MEIWISNDQEKVPLTEAHEEVVRQVVRQAFERTGNRPHEHVEVSITFVDDPTIAGLNREYRGQDKPTDVLSFSQLEGEEMDRLPEGAPLLLGDIVVNLERCREQAEEYGHSFERELGFLVVHGMLHLMGYDHATPDDEAAMMAQTEGILGGAGLKR